MSPAGSPTGRVHVIVNPRAGRGRCDAALADVRTVLGGGEIRVQRTAAPGDAARWAAATDFAEGDAVAVVGGDGTVHEVVDGLLQGGREPRPVLCVVPAGSGNSLARDLGIDGARAAAERLRAGARRPLDVARLRLPDGRRCHAFHMLGWGLAADAGRLAERLRPLGTARYTLASALVALSARRRRARLLLDDEVLEGALALVYAGNTVHTGGGLRLTPDARLDDGLLDVLVVRAASAPVLLSLLAALRRGRPLDSPLVLRRQVRRLRLEEEVPSVLNVDGEVLGSTPVELLLLPGALTLAA